MRERSREKERERERERSRERSRERDLERKIKREKEREIERDRDKERESDLKCHKHGLFIAQLVIKDIFVSTNIGVGFQALELESPWPISPSKFTVY